MSLVIERLKSGPSVCLDDFATDWAEQAAGVNYLLAASKKDGLLRELGLALTGKRVGVFDTMRKAERDYRPDDAAELTRARLRVIPASVNAWLAGEGLALLEGLPGATDTQARAAQASGPMEPAGASKALDWKAKAQSRAAEIISRQKELDLYPNQQDIADEIAREFRLDGVVGADGKPLSGSTIKRHALGGISSAQSRQLSTSIRRGK